MRAIAQETGIAKSTVHRLFRRSVCSLTVPAASNSRLIPFISTGSCAGRRRYSRISRFSCENAGPRASSRQSGAFRATRLTSSCHVD
ncbi:hypothetical protein KIP88_42570 [Bradyrhizobium sp. SRL28]|nr:hypothetical protein [Bradyrhizobium sp. SRL28]